MNSLHLKFQGWLLRLNRYHSEDEPANPKAAPAASAALKYPVQPLQRCDLHTCAVSGSPAAWAQRGAHGRQQHLRKHSVPMTTEQLHTLPKWEKPSAPRAHGRQQHLRKHSVPMTTEPLHTLPEWKKPSAPSSMNAAKRSAHAKHTWDTHTHKLLSCSPCLLF